MMAIQITISKSTCLLLGAGLGVMMAFILPPSCNACKKKQKNNKNECMHAATNTDKKDDEKPSKLYGDKTMSDILEKAKLSIRKVWNEGWNIKLLNTKTTTTLSSDIFVDAQSSFPITNSHSKGIFNPIFDSDDTESLSTIYTPVGKLSVSQRSSLRDTVKKGFKDIAKGYKRSHTSKNDSICKSYPKHASTLIEVENKSKVQGVLENENTQMSNEFHTNETNNESHSDRKLVLNFKTSFSPIIRIFQAIKSTTRKRTIKRAKDGSDKKNNEILKVVGSGITM
ncbi:uncharacterized protein LOC131665538 [Phymastichus coffea]|uniref:uncharacterized protein LOC131665538 n=1 Tax=Phymastichus coffea TaxID=108790 RepID=UPI00273A7B47|nr:uncharacterized protein LOC131665538 [Phymastichus coffea]